jgi:hypothetical protein
VLGSSGTAFGWYTIAEYTDNTKATLSKFERGIGSIALSTGVLTRSRVDVTWTSGGSYVRGGATALTFGNTAANIDILFGDSGASVTAHLPGLLDFASVDIWQPLNSLQVYSSAVSTWSMNAGDRLWVPTFYRHNKPISQVAVKTATGQPASNMRVGIYDCDPIHGGAGNILTEFTSGSQIATTVNSSYRSVTLGTPFRLIPGWYWTCLQGDTNAVTIDRLDVPSNPGASHFSQRDLMFFVKNATYGALPATGDASASSSNSRSGGGQPAVFFQ